MRRRRPPPPESLDHARNNAAHAPPLLDEADQQRIVDDLRIGVQEQQVNVLQTV